MSETADLREIVARAIAAHYWTMGRVSKRPSFSWDDLEDVHRESYRRWGDAVLARLREAGYRLIRPEPAGELRTIVGKAIAQSQARPDWAWEPGKVGTDAYLMDADAALTALREAGALAGLTAAERAAEEFGERVDAMARVIYEAYGAMIGFPDNYRWDDAVASPDEYSYSLAKFRTIADDALDKIEWTRFYLARKDEAAVHPGNVRDAIGRMVDGIDTGDDRNLVRRWLGR